MKGFNVVILISFLLGLSHCGPISAADQAIILQLHAQARAAVNPPAANMAPLVWDNTLATSASNYAATCASGHSGLPGLGENLSWGWPTMTSTAAVQAWVNEGPSYVFANATCATGIVCGHYTQMIWATTTNIGCGMTSCTNGLLGHPQTDFWVCHYTPPGNVVGQQAYIAAAPGTSTTSPSTAPSTPSTAPNMPATTSTTSNGLAAPTPTTAATSSQATSNTGSATPGAMRVTQRAVATGAATPTATSGAQPVKVISNAAMDDPTFVDVTESADAPLSGPIVGQVGVSSSDNITSTKARRASMKRHSGMKSRDSFGSIVSGPVADDYVFGNVTILGFPTLLKN